MNRSILLTLSLLLCAPAFAIDVDPRLDEAVRTLLPVCDGAKIRYESSPTTLPMGFKSAVVIIESERHSCDGQLVAAMSPTGGFFLGAIWPLGEEQGTTLEEKLSSFTLNKLREAMTITVERKATEDGLIPVSVAQSTEAGKLVLNGFADLQGRVFFLGNFRRLSGDILAQRAKTFEAFTANAPSKGAADSAVTIVEFSDFQCPSCKRSSGYADPILAAHPGKVRYIRFDLPLAGHPWAFPAALAGRAIHRQNPALFWDYKKDVYENQDKLTAFMFWDWARNWASDHELDLKRYDSDLANEEIRGEILRGVGTAFSNDIRSTPTYLVNGAVVDSGDEGKALAAYVDSLLKK